MSYAKIILKPRINNQIQAKEIRVIDADSNNLGVMTLSDALKLSLEQGLDLVETAPNARPPVVKIIDYGKYKYEIEKAERKQRVKERKDIIKTVQISFGAQMHDLAIRAKQVEAFLRDGHKVQVVMRLRGREKAHLDIARKKMHHFLGLLPSSPKLVQERQTPKGPLVLLTKS